MQPWMQRNMQGDNDLKTPGEDAKREIESERVRERDRERADKEKYIFNYATLMVALQSHNTSSVVLFSQLAEHTKPFLSN